MFFDVSKQYLSTEWNFQKNYKIIQKNMLECVYYYDYLY